MSDVKRIYLPHALIFCFWFVGTGLLILDMLYGSLTLLYLSGLCCAAIVYLYISYDKARWRLMWERISEIPGKLLRIERVSYRIMHVHMQHDDGQILVHPLHWEEDEGRWIGHACWEPGFFPPAEGKIIWEAKNAGTNTKDKASPERTTSE